VLRGVVIPPVGGDTVWANTVAAYETLSPALRGLADQLSAIHGNAYDYGATRPNATARQVQRYENVFKSTIHETEHPVVQVHPLTGERAIVLGSFVRRLLGVSMADSAHLFAILEDQVTRLENTVRWRWSAGDVVIWDNRATRAGVFGASEMAARCGGVGRDPGAPRRRRRLAPRTPMPPRHQRGGGPGGAVWWRRPTPPMMCGGGEFPVGLALVVRISPPEPTGRPISDTVRYRMLGRLLSGRLWF
jgi:Taurine catabolism dioxygenase TauD, TfdA family